MQNNDLEKVYFEPSTLETIDQSVYNFVENLSLHTTTNKGFVKVPVLWGTSERSFLTKDKKEVRDIQGALIFPLISVRRVSLNKPLSSPGAFQGTVPEIADNQGGSLEISRVINQDKTKNFANADANRQFGQQNYPFNNQKIVYKTISVPMPVNVELTYEVAIRTDFQQQMNELVLPFITKPGTINSIALTNGDHRYEGFIQDQYQTEENLSSFTDEERKFETKISIKVVGYLVGQGANREKPHFSIRENFVEVKIPREKVITDPKELEKYNL